MSLLKLVSVVLVVSGILVLVYGSFTYPKETHEAKVGPIEVSIKENKTVNVPAWAGASAIVIGGALFFISCKKCKV